MLADGRASTLLRARIDDAERYARCAITHNRLVRALERRQRIEQPPSAPSAPFTAEEPAHARP